MSFSEKLVYLRNTRNLTQPQFATALSRSIGTISNWECGKTIPNGEQLTEIADFFGVSTDFLLCRRETSDPVICAIQRARECMTSADKKKMETLLTIAFDINFGEE